jgi:hypothetical protein
MMPNHYGGPGRTNRVVSPCAASRRTSPSPHNDPAAHRPRSARSADAVRCSRELGGGPGRPHGWSSRTRLLACDASNRDRDKREHGEGSTDRGYRDGEALQ